MNHQAIAAFSPSSRRNINRLSSGFGACTSFATTWERALHSRCSECLHVTHHLLHLSLGELFAEGRHDATAVPDLPKYQRVGDTAYPQVLCAPLPLPTIKAVATRTLSLEERTALILLGRRAHGGESEEEDRCQSGQHEFRGKSAFHWAMFFSWLRQARIMSTRASTLA